VILGTVGVRPLADIIALLPGRLLLFTIPTLVTVLALVLHVQARDRSTRTG
jgi:hypothetical protein